MTNYHVFFFFFYHWLLRAKRKVGNTANESEGCFTWYDLITQHSIGDQEQLWFTTTDFSFCLLVSNVLPEMGIKNLMVQTSLNVSFPTNITFVILNFLFHRNKGVACTKTPLQVTIMKVMSIKK